MKSIVLTSKPTEAENILNDKQKIIVRKKFPKDYEGWCYIYVTKSGKLFVHNKYTNCYFLQTKQDFYNELSKCEDDNLTFDYLEELNGKVVARFWCDKVEEMYTVFIGMSYYTDTIKEDYMVYKLACLDDSDIYNYLGDKIGCAIHISKLEIFDEPKDLNEFERYNYLYCDFTFNLIQPVFLNKAPKNYCYIEEELENDK